MNYAELIAKHGMPEARRLWKEAQKAATREREREHDVPEQVAPQVAATFPSWRPQRCLDHILLSSELVLERVEVLSLPISDHLPVAVDIRLPGALNLPML